MVEVSVAKLGLDSSSRSYVVILQEKGGSRLLPIWIGQPEAESIVMEMNGVKAPRPLTHDLCKRLIEGLGGALRRIQITRVENNTYYAELHIQRGDQLYEIDARPSDSIAIALRLEAPIFAQDDLLHDITLEERDEESADSSIAAESQAQLEQLRMSAEQLKTYLQQMRPEDFGKFRL